MIEKIKRWIKNHKKETIIGSSLFVVLFIFLISYSLAVLTPVKSIVITSKNTSFEDNEAGSWQVVKSAKWTGVGEAEVSFDLNTVGKYVYENRDIILVIDTSDSMSNDNRIGVVRDNSVELISSVFDENSNNRISFFGDEIESITATFEEDNDNEKCMMSCSSISVESYAPDDINDAVAASLYNRFAGVRYNDVGEDGFEDEAAEDIAREAKVDPSQVDIERE